MKWRRLIKVAFKSILKNRMRSFLTMLGIIIGVGAVIALVAVGQGASADIEGQISTLGTNLVIVMPGSSRSGGVNRGASSLNTLRMADVRRLEKQAVLLRYVSPVINAAGQVIAGGKNWSTRTQGVNHNYLEIRDWSLESGRFFTERENRSRKKVAVLGKTVVDELFGDSDPVGTKIRIRNIPYTVIGVLSEKGQSMMGNQDDVILAPCDTVLYRMSDGKTVNMIMGSAVSTDDVNAAQEEIKNILRDEHRLRAGEEEDFRVRSQTDAISTITGVTGILTMLLGAIAGVSLLVGGIGIMNIMLVSVTERTREIGIRMAIGARSGDILLQFLIEAVMLSMLGGIIGIILGIGLGELISSIFNTSLLVSPVITFIAFFFSGAVGVFFGFYPARKASRLNPIDALHYE